MTLRVSLSSNNGFLLVSWVFTCVTLSPLEASVILLHSWAFSVPPTIIVVLPRLVVKICSIKLLRELRKKYYSISSASTYQNEITNEFFGALGTKHLSSTTWRRSHVMGSVFAFRFTWTLTQLATQKWTFTQRFPVTSRNSSTLWMGDGFSGSNQTAMMMVITRDQVGTFENIPTF